MNDPGTFTVTKTTVRRRTSINRYAGFKTFICALFIFLVVLILISSLMFAFKFYKKISDNEQDSFDNKNIFGNTTSDNLDIQDISTIHSMKNYSDLQTIADFGSSELFETATETIDEVVYGIESQENEDITVSPRNPSTIFQIITNNDAKLVPSTEIINFETTTDIPPPPIDPNTSEVISISTDTPNSTIFTANTAVPPVVNVSQPPISRGYFGFNFKPAAKIVNKQLPVAPGLTIRTVNDPPACLEPVCKRSASSMLAMKNHANQLNYCEDYYSAICHNPHLDNTQKFFKNSLRSIQKSINAAKIDSIRYFNSFFKQCIDYGYSINRISRISGLEGTGANSDVEAIIISILTQSMPFFDVGINILNNKFIFEMTLPGSNYLKTNIKGWSLREQFQENCIAEIANGVSQNVELDILSNKIDDCINDQTTRYLNDFMMELEPISKLPGMGFLGGVLTKLQNMNPFRGSKLQSFNPFGSGGKNGGNSESSNTGDTKTDLSLILRQVQDSWIIYRKAKNPSMKLKLITLSELTKRYNLGIDWTDVFQELTQRPIGGDTQIYFSEHLDQIFKIMINNKNNLKEMLDLWYNVQFYKNIVIEKQVGNRVQYCMDLAAQLIPEVSSYVISDLNKNRKQLYDLVDGVFEDIKQRFEKSLLLANFSSDSIKILKNRIDSISITRPILSSPSSGSQNVGFFDYWSISGTYQEQLIQLIKHYKKMLFDQVSTNVTGDILLKYFVYAFDTVPKTYPPNREIIYQPGFTDEMADNLPNYVKLAKQGLPLAQQFSKHFIRNDFSPKLDKKDEFIYDEMLKTFDTKYLVDKSKYKIENIDCIVEDVSGKNFKYISVEGDNLAFRLVSDMYLEDPRKIPLPFADYTHNETFITMALQDFCNANSLADFIGDFYNLNLPAPIKVKNMALNSELFAGTYSCPPRNRKQFPFIQHN
ncbi:uncharacterized protein LOC130902738 [Diorhabda carinulata]|uniref:uncharacterized protein LOC130902738 n=1 Tax=Diorhabda carinulata TaxID=1163345 RepID=UPI0025A1494E|nr:uncharacterized protein LOC130902738 [Diorhabda carinulata]